MWLAALAGRIGYFTHQARGHAVTWTAAFPDGSLCAGDIVCHDCGQVLWCRAHDPWRTAVLEGPPDHWGGTRRRQAPSALFDALQHVLRLAAACPDGPTGASLRRAACELVEAASSRQRAACRRRMLHTVVRLRWEQSRPGYGNHHLSPVVLDSIIDALGRDLTSEQ